MHHPFDVTELDSTWVDLLQGPINSLSRWDCLRYFLETGEWSATLDQIAMASGRESAILLDDLGALTSDGWLLRRRDEAGDSIYQLTQADDKLHTLDALLSAMQNDSFRLKALYQWTRARSADAEPF
ncbi:MAG: hypothetical protein KDD73_14875 [Anaerolineales bacterium]|nr:hypothetical protein [Anaerolineales bacterium]MCB9171330.1 hypothetical protein [Ardenticatenales bacterium]